MFNYDDNVTINLTKVTFDGEFTHWESEIIIDQGELYCQTTAPTIGGAIDEAIDYLYNMKHEWTRDDANKRN